MAFAAANDLLTMTIPNRISLALIGAFFIAVPLVGLDMQTMSLHLLAGFVILIAGIVLFSFNLLGGGDAKLMAAGALWMGPEHLLYFVAYLTIFGGMLAFGILMYRKYIPAEVLPLPDWAKKLHVRNSGIPYGIAIASAAMILYPQTVWFTGLPL